MHFADRIIETCKTKESRLCVGLDPHWDRIPDSFKTGEDIEATLVTFFTGVIEATLTHAVCYKPQIAFFEQFGLAGLTAFKRLLEILHQAEAIVVTDAKRNDIGSTAAAYARAYFGDTAAFPSHGLTVNGYLGGDGIHPFLTNTDHGIFVLVKTSNPSSGELQDVLLADGQSVAHRMARAVHTWNSNTLGDSGYGNGGAVIGATYPEHMHALRGLMPQSLILVPGYGAQGGDAAAVKAAFNTDGLGALINSSRGISFPPDLAQKGFKAVAEAAAAARTDINTIIAG